MSYVTLEDIINFECFENFPNSGFTSLNFPIRKTLGPLPKLPQKSMTYYICTLTAIILTSKTGAGGQHGRGKPGTAAPTRGRGRGRAKPSPTVNTQRGSLLPDPTSEQTDQGYGIEQHNPG